MYAMPSVRFNIFAFILKTKKEIIVRNVYNIVLCIYYFQTIERVKSRMKRQHGIQTHGEHRDKPTNSENLF